MKQLNLNTWKTKQKDIDIIEAIEELNMGVIITGVSRGTTQTALTERYTVNQQITLWTLQNGVLSIVWQRDFAK